MGELIVAALTVFAALTVHFVVWRIRVPKRQTRAVLIIFFGLLAVVVAALPSIVSHAAMPGLSLPLRLPSYLHIIIFVTAAALSYMMTYTVIEVDSPSLVMTHAIGQTGLSGMPDVEFDRMMDNRLLVEPRIQDMLRDGLIRRSGEVYELTSKGRNMVRLFMLHRSLLGAGKGG